MRRLSPELSYLLMAGSLLISSGVTLAVSDGRSRASTLS
jgi:hypothetical protein